MIRIAMRDGRNRIHKAFFPSLMASQDSSEAMRNTNGLSPLVMVMPTRPQLEFRVLTTPTLFRSTFRQWENSVMPYKANAPILSVKRRMTCGHYRNIWLLADR